MVERIEEKGEKRVVDWISGNEYTKLKLEIPSWSKIVKDFRILKKEELPSDFKEGFYYKTILTDVPIYMEELMKFAKKLEIKINILKIVDFKQFLGNLSDENVFCVLNCCGLGANELLGDTKVQPIAGQVVKIETKPFYHPKKFFFNDDPNSLAYVIMRTNCVILGGSAVVNCWKTVPDEEFTKEIIRRCLEISPTSEVPRNPKILEVKVGLRPGRETVRLEKEVFVVKNKNGENKKINVIHNYCHSGSGWTLHLGCVVDVMRLLCTRDSKL